MGWGRRAADKTTNWDTAGTAHHVKTQPVSAQMRPAVGTEHYQQWERWAGERGAQRKAPGPSFRTPRGRHGPAPAPLLNPRCPLRDFTLNYHSPPMSTRILPPQILIFTFSSSLAVLWYQMIQFMASCLWNSELPEKYMTLRKQMPTHTLGLTPNTPLRRAGRETQSYHPLHFYIKKANCQSRKSSFTMLTSPR